MNLGPKENSSLEALDGMKNAGFQNSEARKETPERTVSAPSAVFMGDKNDSAELFQFQPRLRTTITQSFAEESGSNCFSDPDAMGAKDRNRAGHTEEFVGGQVWKLDAGEFSDPSGGGGRRGSLTLVSKDADAISAVESLIADPDSVQSVGVEITRIVGTHREQSANNTPNSIVGNSFQQTNGTDQQSAGKFIVGPTIASSGDPFASPRSTSAPSLLRSSRSRSTFGVSTSPVAEHNHLNGQEAIGMKPQNNFQAEMHISGPGMPPQIQDTGSSQNAVASNSGIHGNQTRAAYGTSMPQGSGFVGQHGSQGSIPVPTAVPTSIHYCAPIMQQHSALPFGQAYVPQGLPPASGFVPDFQQILAQQHSIHSSSHLAVYGPNPTAVFHQAPYTASHHERPYTMQEGVQARPPSQWGLGANPNTYAQSSDLSSEGHHVNGKRTTDVSAKDDKRAGRKDRRPIVDGGKKSRSRHPRRQDGYAQQPLEVGNPARETDATGAQTAMASLALSGGSASEEDAQNVDLEVAINQQPSSLQGRVLLLGKDQVGCRSLQKLLEEKPAQFLDVIWSEVKDHLSELMLDPFGNYLCQKIFPLLDDDFFDFAVGACAPSAVQMGLNLHGTRAIQRLMSLCRTDAQADAIIEELGKSAVQLSQDVNGNHVIQKALDVFSNTRCSVIFNTILDNLVEVSCHRHGCCVLQKAAMAAKGETLNRTLDKMVEHCSQLVKDPFGNYAYQYVVEHHSGARDQLVKALSGDIRNLSCHKFSSNVIEKCMKFAAPETMRVMIQALAERETIETLLQDPYANYVVQRALQITGASDDTLVTAIKPHLPAIRGTAPGRRIATLIAKYSNGGGASVSASAHTRDSDKQRSHRTNQSRKEVTTTHGARPRQTRRPNNSFSLKPGQRNAQLGWASDNNGIPISTMPQGIPYQPTAGVNLSQQQLWYQPSAPLASQQMMYAHSPHNQQGHPFAYHGGSSGG